jgi:hypothetical protein
MKRSFAILVLVLLLSLAASVSPALADELPVRVAGEITALDKATGQLTLKPRYRDPITVQTSDLTEFYRKVHRDGLEPIYFDDLEVGAKVRVTGTWDGEVLDASEVVMVPPPPPLPVAIYGAISAIDSDNATLLVKLSSGDEVTVQTLEVTQFYRVTQHGRLEPIAFEDLAIDDWVRVRGVRDGEVLNAQRVTVMPLTPPPPPRLAVGRIASLDPAGTFNLEPHRGDAIPVSTGDDTKFYRKVRWGRLEPIGFSDLLVGDWVAVFGWWDGTILNAGKVIVMRGPTDSLDDVLEEKDLMQAEETSSDIAGLQAAP